MSIQVNKPAKLLAHSLSGGQYMTESGYLTPGTGPEYSRNLGSDSVDLGSLSASAITRLKSQYEYGNIKCQQLIMATVANHTS